MSVESVMLSNHLILCHLLLLLPSIFPSIGVFPVSWLFTSGGQSIGASASATVLPVNILDGLKHFDCLKFVSYSPGGQKSDIVLTVLKSGCWQASVPPESPRGESVFLSFLASRGCACSLAHGSLPSWKPAMVVQVFLMLWWITLDLHFFGWGAGGKEPLHKQFSLVVNSPVIPCMSEINFSTFFLEADL